MNDWRAGVQEYGSQKGPKLADYGTGRGSCGVTAGSGTKRAKSLGDFRG